MQEIVESVDNVDKCFEIIILNLLLCRKTLKNQVFCDSYKILWINVMLIKLSTGKKRENVNKYVDNVDKWGKA